MIKRMFWLTCIVWMSPLVIYWALPYTLPFQIDYIYVFSIVGLFLLMLYLTTRIRADIEPRAFSDGVKAANRWHVSVALSSALFVYIDLFVVRGLALSNPLYENRAIYTASSPSVFGYLGYIAMATTIYNMARVKLGGVRGKLFYAGVGLTCGLMLISGNRQIFFFSILVVYLSKFFLVERSMLKVAVLTAVAVGIFFTAMLSYQLARQSDIAGNQVNFLYRVSKIECNGSFLCRSKDFGLPFVYLFQYYGNEYPGLTLARKLDISTPPMSLTLPVLYRRLAEFQLAEKQSSILASVNDTIHDKTGVYPRFWKTMFFQIIADYGWTGFFAFLAIQYCIFYLIIKRISSGHSAHLFTLFSAFNIFGIMYIPSVEPVLFFVLLFVVFSAAYHYFGKRAHLAPSRQRPVTVSG